MREHPRARGENSADSRVGNPVTGTSPRTRGKHAMIFNQQISIRNIPAHAGKTGPGAHRCRSSPEHPRARGENNCG